MSDHGRLSGRVHRGGDSRTPVNPRRDAQTGPLIGGSE